MYHILLGKNTAISMIFIYNIHIYQIFQYFYTLSRLEIAIFIEVAHRPCLAYWTSLGSHFLYRSIWISKHQIDGRLVFRSWSSKCGPRFLWTQTPSTFRILRRLRHYYSKRIKRRRTPGEVLQYEGTRDI